jgi:aspartate-semialdehyde dehydrogenase
MTKPLKLAVAGATGATGRAVLEVLAERDVPLERLRLLASARSAGTTLEFGGGEVKVEAVREGAFRGFDVAVLAVPAEVARALAAQAVAEGCLAVDGSPAFRRDPDVPLVVPEVNPGALAAPPPRGIVASPGGIATGVAVALAPLAAAAGLERVAVATYQSVSGAGHRGVLELERQAADLMNAREPEPASVFPHRVAWNVVPAIGAIGPDGVSEEERKIADELRRLLGAPGLGVTATAVRVPVFHGHAAAVNLRTRAPLSAEEARRLLRAAPGVKVIDAEGVYPMPMLAVNDDAVLVGRIREDASQERGLDLFLVLDDQRKGSAANLVELALALAAKRG